MAFSIPPLIMPTEEELFAACRPKYERVAPFMIDQWPASVAALSFPTKLIPFDAARFSQLWDDGPVADETAQWIADTLDAEMGWDQYFIRLNSRSPKDVIDLPVTCAGKQAAAWIRCSERCLDDVSVAVHAKAPLFVCLREARHLHPDGEFRCFAKDGEVIAVTRYFYHTAAVMQLPEAAKLMEDAKRFYRDHLAEHYSTVVFDLYAPGSTQELLIELNPYGMSDPCLFGTYAEVEKGGVRLAQVGAHP